jgi:hypothetical protein
MILTLRKITEHHFDRLRGVTRNSVIYISQILPSRFPVEHRRREQRELVLTISRVACVAVTTL